MNQNSKKILLLLTLFSGFCSSLLAEENVTHFSAEENGKNSVSENGGHKWWNDIEYTFRAGYAIGGTIPVDFPVEMRGLNSYTPKFNYRFSLNARKQLNKNFSLETALIFERRGFKSDVTMKHYQITLEQGGEKVTGPFSGNVVINAVQTGITIPINAVWHLSDKVSLKAGPYVSFITDKNFHGYAYGEKVYDAAGNEIKGAPGAVVNGTVTYSYTSLNKLFSDKEATHIVEPNKFNYVILDMDKTDYGNDDNHTIGEGIFTRQNTEDFVNISDGSGKALLDADGNKIMIKNNVNANGQRSDYTLGNILVNPETSQEVGKIPMTDAQGKEDMAKGQALVDAWNADFASLEPESYAVGNFQTFYNNFVSEFSTIGKVLSNFVDHQETMVNGYDNQRLQSEGVSSDEELEKMIKYQQSYNAASRYINVVSEMIEHLITSLGRA